MAEVTEVQRSWALDYDTANCNIAAALAIVGEKWTFLVLREAFNGVRRFGEHAAPDRRAPADPQQPAGSFLSATACYARCRIRSRASGRAASTG